MKVTILKIKHQLMFGCLGVIALWCCLYFAIIISAYIIVSNMDTVVKDGMSDPEFRKKIEELLDFEFPASVKWEKNEYRVWQSATFDCFLTLPKKDVDLMLPPDKVTWHENDLDMLALSGNWLKKKKLDHFKVAKYEPDSKRKLFVTVVVDNPPGNNEDQRVWCYIHFLWL